MNRITLGRRPTLREVLGYYEREDFRAYLAKVCGVRRVVLVVNTQAYWEPDWRGSEVTAERMADLPAFLRGRVEAAYPGAGLDDPLPFYPSFHQALERRSLDGAESGPAVADAVLEADSLTWREAFWHVHGALDLLAQHGVCYHHKFSGHRSLHVVVPGDVFAAAGVDAYRFARRLAAWNGAGHPVEILRMPYSLNEDTGLVSLPIAREEFADFRPWQANLHLVEIRDVWAEETGPQHAAGMRALMRALRSRSRADAHAAAARPVPSGFCEPNPARVTERYGGRLRALHADGAEYGPAAALLLAAEEPMCEAQLAEGLSHTDADVQWLSLEAFLLHGRSLSRATFDRLLDTDDPYISACAIQLLVKFRTDVLGCLVDLVASTDFATALTAGRGRTAFLLLTRTRQVWYEVLEEMAARGGASPDGLLAAACVTGAIMKDWTRALQLVADLRRDDALPPATRTRLAALDLLKATAKRQLAGDPAAGLSALGPAAVGLLLIAAGARNRRLKRAAVSALAEQAGESGLTMLIGALEDGDSQVRERAAEGLVRLGESAVAALCEVAATDQVALRRYAVRCLADIGSPRGRTVLLQGMSDADKRIRRHALRGLARAGTAADVERLERAAREEQGENARVAATSVQALRIQPEHSTQGAPV